MKGNRSPENKKEADPFLFGQLTLCVQKVEGLLRGIDASEYAYSTHIF
jgi:hypothetical protein